MESQTTVLDAQNRLENVLRLRNYSKKTVASCVRCVMSYLKKYPQGVVENNRVTMVGHNDTCIQSDPF